MDSSQRTSIGKRLSRLVGLVGLAAAAVVVSVYVAQRQRNTRHAEHTDDQPVATPEIVQTVGAASPSGTTTPESGETVQAQGSVRDNPVPDPQPKPSEVSAQEDETVQRIHEETTVRPLEELTVEELYRLAQRHDIAGRSNMRKAQLVEALQAQGIKAAESPSA